MPLMGGCSIDEIRQLCLVAIVESDFPAVEFDPGDRNSRWLRIGAVQQTPLNNVLKAKLPKNLGAVRIF